MCFESVCFYFCVSLFCYLLVVWLSGNALFSIMLVALHQAWLVLRCMIVRSQVYLRIRTALIIVNGSKVAVRVADIDHRLSETAIRKATLHISHMLSTNLLLNKAY